MKQAQFLCRFVIPLVLWWCNWITKNGLIFRNWPFIHRAVYMWFFNKDQHITPVHSMLWRKTVTLIFLLFILGRLGLHQGELVKCKVEFKCFALKIVVLISWPIREYILLSCVESVLVLPVSSVLFCTKSISSTHCIHQHHPHASPLLCGKRSVAGL
jgi:hypothetical protein